MLAEEGRDREALEHAERAVALDPLAGAMQQTLALVNYSGRRYDRATPMDGVPSSSRRS